MARHQDGSDFYFFLDFYFFFPILPLFPATCFLIS